jgi:hypothetical protein
LQGFALEEHLESDETILQFARQQYVVIKGLLRKTMPDFPRYLQMINIKQ